jgi:two-component system, LytTR family, response regulator LytT
MDQPNLRIVVIVPDDGLRDLVVGSLEERKDMDLVQAVPHHAAALPTLRKERVDALVLCCTLPGMSGFDLLGLLSECPTVVMLADDPAQAMAGFDAGVCDLLLLPFDKARFMLAMDRCVSTVFHPREMQAGTSADQHVLVLPGVRRSLRLPIKFIRMIQAQGNQVLVYGDGQAMKVNCTMKRMEELLKGHPFLRVHRSYIVALREMRDMDRDSLFTAMGEIPLGAAYRHQVQKYMSKQ